MFPKSLLWSETGERRPGRSRPGESSQVRADSLGLLLHFNFMVLNQDDH